MVHLAMGAFYFTNLTRAQEIGANCYLVEAEGKRMVMDAGLHPREEGGAALPDLSRLGEEPLDGIVLSHSHQDHVGALPVLMRRQPRTPVFMTEATRALSEAMLHNSVNVMLKRKNEGVSDYPLFTHREIDLCVRRWVSAPLRQRFDLSGERMGHADAGLSLEFFDAGHILGSVGTLLRSEGRTLFYTGDVNFEDQTLMKGAKFPESGVDVLVMETTRGDRASAEGFTREAEEQRLAESIQAAFDRGGGVLLPLFALGKTQEVLALFFEFRRRGWLRRDCAIYIGGLGAKLSEIHDRLAGQTCRHHPSLQLLDDVSPFVVGGQDAQSLPVKPGRIYALSSGMMTEKTLSNTVARLVLSEPEHSLIFVGYSDPESPAGRLLSAKPGSMVQVSPEFAAQPLRCRVERFSLSGHSSRESIRAYVNRARPKKIVLVHGDTGALEWFRATLQSDLPESEVMTAPPGERLTL